jgi:hypothetical protein
MKKILIEIKIIFPIKKGICNNKKHSPTTKNKIQMKKNRIQMNQKSKTIKLKTPMTQKNHLTLRVTSHPKLSKIKNKISLLLKNKIKTKIKSNLICRKALELKM